MLRQSLIATSCLVLGLFACSKDSPKNTPDATPLPDGTSNGCIATTFGAQDLIFPNDGMAVTWGGPITPGLTGAATSQIQFQFYQGVAVGAADLTMGVNANFSTCTTCVLAFARDATGKITKRFFQSAGTVTLTADPITGNTMAGSYTGVQLVEVTVDSMSVSTPVVGGACLSIADATLAHDGVPNAWTCAKPAFNAGTDCDCACGVHDPDCDMSNTVVGCTGTQVCANHDVCTDTCKVLAPTKGCTTGTCGFETSTTDICYTDATLIDAAAVGGTCTSTTALFCGVTSTIATGVCDSFVGNDLACRKACDADAQCGVGNVCSPVVGAKGFCITPPANDKCQNATTIVIGTPVNGDSTYAVSNYDNGLETAACTNGAQGGPDVAYKVVLTANQAITATLSAVGANFDPSLAIVGPSANPNVCDADPIVCDKGADVGLAGAGETVAFTAPSAGIYYIIVDTFSAPGGQFTLTVTSP